MNLTTRKNPNWVASVLGNVTRLAGKEIACGYPKGKVGRGYPDGESVVEVAAKNCFGIGVPQRDFMSYAQPEIINKTRGFMLAIAKLAGSADTAAKAKIAALMETAGQKGAEAIKDAITNGSYQPNSPATLNIKVGGTNPHGKMSTKPLIDTQLMRGSTTSVVRDAKK